MSYYLFESPRLGLMIAAIVEILLILGWLFARDRTRPIVLLAGPVIAGLFLLADWAVVTNREQLEQNTREIVQAAEEQNADKILSYVSDKFLYQGNLNKASLSVELKRLLSKPLIEDNIIRELIVKKVDKQEGQVELVVFTTIDPKSHYAGYTGFVQTKWRFDYVREASGKYKLINSTMLNLNGGEPMDILRLSKEF